MTITFDDDDLIAALGEALAPELVEPGPEALAAMHRALAARAGPDEDDGLAPVVPILQPVHRSAAWAGIRRLRHPVAAAVAVGVLATSGVAAAGVATDHLPGPTRTVAYSLGLPVTSPALEAAEGTMGELRTDLGAHDLSKVTASAALLRAQLGGLSALDHARIQGPADDLLAEADVLAQASAAGAASSGPAAAGADGSTGPESTRGPGAAGTSSDGGITSSDGGSSSGSDSSSGGAAPGTSGAAPGNPEDTAPGTGSPDAASASPQSSADPTPTTTPGPPTNTTLEAGDREPANNSIPAPGTTRPGDLAGTAPYG